MSGLISSSRHTICPQNTEAVTENVLIKVSQALKPSDMAFVLRLGYATRTHAHLYRLIPLNTDNWGMWWDCVIIFMDVWKVLLCMFCLPLLVKVSVVCSGFTRWGIRQSLSVLIIVCMLGEEVHFEIRFILSAAVSASLASQNIPAVWDRLTLKAIAQGLCLSTMNHHYSLRKYKQTSVSPLKAFYFNTSQVL